MEQDKVEGGSLSDFPNYIIYNNGCLFNKKTGKWLSPTVCKSTGYKKVTLRHNGIRKKISIHRMVGLVHIPNPENKPTINHIDGNKLNNCVSNLEWATYKENAIHSWKIGLCSRFSDKKSAAAIKNGRLMANEVINIETGEIFPSASVLATKLGFSKGYVCRFLKGVYPNYTKYILLSDYEKSNKNSTSV